MGEGSTKTKHLRRGVGEKYSGKEMYLTKIEMQKITNLDDVRLHAQQFDLYRARPLIYGKITRKQIRNSD